MADFVIKGNDAGYTVEALIGISFKALTYEPPKAPDPERLSAAAAEAQARLIEDIEEWEIAREEGGDGGSAVKLLPAAEMAQARAFQQGLRRAVKVEEGFDRSYTRDNATARQKHSQGGKGTTGYDEGYGSPRIAVERKGEIKYHAANEKKMREKAAQKHDDDDDDDWGWIGEADGKAVGQNDGADAQNEKPTTHTTSHNARDPNYIPPHKRPLQNRVLKELTNKKKTKDDTDDLIVPENKPEETPLPPQRLMARLKLLDGDDDDADGGVALS